MKRTFFLFACLLLLAPALSVDRPARAEAGNGDSGLVALPATPMGVDAIVNEKFGVLERARQPKVASQVRVERRVVIRIAPSSEATRTRLMAELPRRPLRTQFQEAEHGDCIEIAELAGVQPMENNRLLLITSDRQLLTALLERSCSAQAFYLGFYIERNDDGQLCIARDRLQSRAGDSCQVEEFHRLVAVRD